MKRYFFVFSLIFLAGCSSEVDLKQFENKTAENIYVSAIAYMEKKEYSSAVQVLEELEKLHPYSKQAIITPLKLGDCHYRMKKYDDSATEYEVFIKLHPTHELAPYAVYMLGLVNYEQMPIIERDQELTIKAADCFSVLLREYPTCQYASQAKKMLKELRQHLAGREIYVSKYYQTHNNYAAAICRLNTVLRLYSDTDHFKEALYRLVECYVAMGLFPEANRVNELLQKRFPKTNWARHSADLMARLRK
jgi:outer membrane protein assembly factor BamD